MSRLFRLIEAFGTDSSVSVSELSHRTGLPLPTVSRMVSELVDQGWLQRKSGRKVSIGVRMWELAAGAAPAQEIRQTALPYMSELHARVGHHVTLAVRDGGDVLFVDRLSAPRAVRAVIGPVGRLPLHASAPGLALLAHASTDVQNGVLAGPLPAIGARPVTDPRELRSLLSEIRKVGSVTCGGWLDPVTTSIAVPLFSGTRVVAALSLVVPHSDAVRGATPALQQTGARISRALTHTNLAAVTRTRIHPTAPSVRMRSTTT